MAKNEKPTSKDFDEKRGQEAKEAKKKLKEAEKAKSPGTKKAKADKADKKKSKKAKRFWKDFRGESKKIVWPDFKTVMKNTGIVLVTVVVIGAMVWILDFILSGSVRRLKNLAQGARTEQTTVDFGDYAEPETTLVLDAEATEEAETAAGDETEPVTEPETEPVTEPVTEPAE